MVLRHFLSQKMYQSHILQRTGLTQYRYIQCIFDNYLRYLHYSQCLFVSPEQKFPPPLGLMRISWKPLFPCDLLVCKNHCKVGITSLSYQYMIVKYRPWKTLISLYSRFTLDLDKCFLPDGVTSYLKAIYRRKFAFIG